MSKLMVVDDDQGILRAFKRTLRKSDFKITTFDSPLKAIEASKEDIWDVVISDYKMPEMDGIQFLESVQKHLPHALLIIMSANIDLTALAEALNRANIHRFITKPWDDLLLGRTINEAVNHQKLLFENQKLADEVRMQKKVIDKQQSELQRLEQESPGITQVEFDEDGAIVLGDFDLD